MPRFNRTASLAIGAPGQEGISITDLAIAFKVLKSDAGAQNKAVIQVRNLSKDKQNAIGTTGTVVILNAGYVDEPDLPRLVCAMDVIDVRSIQTGAVVTTIISAIDGVSNLRSKKLSVSYIGGKSVKQILSELATRNGITLRRLDTIIDKVYSQGYAARGPIGDILDELAAKVGATWSWQNRELVFTKLGEPQDETIFVLNKEKGLIGSPQRRNRIGEPRIPGQNDGWLARSLLLPTVEPGNRLALTSDEVKGLFRVKTVSHVGDTHGQDWYSDVEVVEFA
jgi:hypothetical protein